MRKCDLKTCLNFKLIKNEKICLFKNCQCARNLCSFAKMTSVQQFTPNSSLKKPHEEVLINGMPNHVLIPPPFVHHQINENYNVCKFVIVLDPNFVLFWQKNFCEEDDDPTRLIDDMPDQIVPPP